MKFSLLISMQEGAGPCIFCGSLIFPPDEEKMLAKDSKKAQKIKEKLIKQYNLQVRVIHEQNPVTLPQYMDQHCVQCF